MTDKNTMSLFRYMIYHALALVISGFVCFGFIAPVLSIPLNNKLRFLIILLIISLTIHGIALTYQRRRNRFSVFINAITPIAILILIMRAEVHKVVWIAFAVCAVMLCVGYTYMVYKHCPKVRDRLTRKQMANNYRRRSFLGARTIVTLLLVVLAIITVVQRVSSVSDPTGSNTSIECDFSEYTIESQHRSLGDLRNDKWNDLLFSEKINVLNTVKYIELNDLGVDHDIQLICKDLGEHMQGCYEEHTHTIYLNETFLDSIGSAGWVDTVCHEIWHAKEHQLCRLYETMPEQYRNMPEFKNVPTYQYEFANYISADTNDHEQVEAYASQMIEYEARQYAEGRILKYFEFIYA